MSSPFEERHPRGHDGRFVPTATAVIGPERLEALRQQAIQNLDAVEGWDTRAKEALTRVETTFSQIHSLDDITDTSTGRATPSTVIQDLETGLRDLGSIIDAEIRNRIGDAPHQDAETAAVWEAVNLRFDLSDHGEHDRVAAADLPERIRRADQQVDGFRSRYRQQTNLHNTRYQNELRSILAELRAVGGEVKTTAVSDPDGVRALQDGARLLPAEWIEASNEEPVRVTVHRTDGRSQYNRDTGELEIGSTPDTGTNDLVAQAAHELAHRVEDSDPTLRVLQWAFFHRRITDPQTGIPQQPMSLSALTGLPGYEDEACCPDHFYNPYIGRVYDGAGPASPYEVLSVGVESLHTGDNGIHHDHDWRSFVVGMLAGA